MTLHSLMLLIIVIDQFYDPNTILFSFMIASQNVIIF